MGLKFLIILVGFPKVPRLGSSSGIGGIGESNNPLGFPNFFAFLRFEGSHIITVFDFGGLKRFFKPLSIQKFPPHFWVKRSFKEELFL